LAFPVFNAGALKANVKAAWAQYEQQALAYEKTVTTAFQEVEAALVAHAKERERLMVVLEELGHAEASSRTQIDRRLRGIGDHLAYLDAERNLFRVRQSITTAHGALVRARLAIHRSLGGVWIEDTEPAKPVAAYDEKTQ
jgi:outer membrane protein TolC